MKHFDQFNGAFTLPDSETDNETDKIGTEPVSVSVQYENFHTIPFSHFYRSQFRPQCMGSANTPSRRSI